MASEPGVIKKLDEVKAVDKCFSDLKLASNLAVIKSSAILTKCLCARWWLTE